MLETRITIGPDRTGTVIVGDTDISAAVGAMTINASARRHPFIDLHLTGTSQLTVAGLAVVRVSAPVRAALIALGWTPPADEENSD